MTPFRIIIHHNKRPDAGGNPAGLRKILDVRKIAFSRAGGKPSRDSDRQGGPSTSERDSWRPLGEVAQRVLAEVAPVVAPK